MQCHKKIKIKIKKTIKKFIWITKLCRSKIPWKILCHQVTEIKIKFRIRYYPTRSFFRHFQIFLASNIYANKQIEKSTIYNQKILSFTSNLHNSHEYKFNILLLFYLFQSSRLFNVDASKCFQKGERHKKRSLSRKEWNLYIFSFCAFSSRWFVADFSVGYIWFDTFGVMKLYLDLTIMIKVLLSNYVLSCFVSKSNKLAMWLLDDVA